MNVEDHPRQLYIAAMVPHIVLAVGMDTSGAVLASVVNLEAAPEVAKSNRFYNKLTNTGLQTVSLMHILEVLGLKDAITVTCSNSKSRFCRLF